MNKQDFDRLLSEIRNEKVDHDLIGQAAERVWNSILAANTTELDVPRLQSCADFQRLLPAYLDSHLPARRVLLMEDHLHQCVACRHAVDQTRPQSSEIAIRRSIESDRRPVLKWAAACALAIGIALGLLGARLGLLPGQHSVRATVRNLEGSLYYVTDSGNRRISAGSSLGDGDEIRTAKDSDAEVQLTDGSVIEVGERSQFSVSRGWQGTTIHLDGGNMIVQSASQRTRELYVATDDCLISAKGAVFSVNHGTKGSRVSVLEGVVKVAYQGRAEELRAGGQITTHSNLSRAPIRDEIAWSRNATKYLALLGEFEMLQKQFAAIPGPALRYQSDLLQYIPDNTVLYAAIPNIGSTLSEADHLFQDRLQQSPVLRKWWNQQQGSRGPKLEEVISRVETFSRYLGDEVVLAVAQNGSQRDAVPVILAHIRQAGLRSFLDEQNRQLSEDKHDALMMIEDPSTLGSRANDALLVYLSRDLMLATTDPAELQRTAALIQQPQSSHFSQTPFYQKITQAYRDGVGWLLSVDMEQILANNVQDRREAGSWPPGFADVKYLVVERRENGGSVENRASITFAPQREGMAAWLAAPAPMGSLDFVSPDASLVASFVTKDAKTMMQEMFQFAENSDPDFTEHLAEFEARAGVSVLDDISAPLGGELTIALDGPMLPVPSWKAVVEIYDRDKFEATITKLVESFNQQAPLGAGKLYLGKRQVGSQTYFILRNGKQDAEIDYTFVDSYLIAAPTQALLARAVQNRESGYTLTRSQAFQAELPHDVYTNFSALFYHNLGAVMKPLAAQLKALHTLSQDEEQEIDAFTANTMPGLIYAYGEPDRIVVASSTGFMGLNLDTFLAISEGRPLLAQLFGNSLNPGANHERRRSGNHGQKP